MVFGGQHQIRVTAVPGTIVYTTIQQKYTKITQNIIWVSLCVV